MTSMIDHHAENVALYREQAETAATAEANYKNAYAQRKLTARHNGAKSVAEAELIADADEQIGDLLSKRLIAAALADGTKQYLLSIRAEIEMERSKMADLRFQDQFHARDRNAI